MCLNESDLSLLEKNTVSNILDLNVKFQFSLLNYSQKELSNNLFESSFLLFVFIPYGNCA